MKTDFLNLKKSRWLLLSLIAIIVGASPAWADAKALPYSYGFEAALATEGWTTQNPSGYNSGEFGIYSAAKKTGDSGFRFSSYSDKGANTQYLISPEFNAPNGINVSFYYKASYGGGTEKFKVGYSTTDTDVSNFTWGEEISISSTSWLLYENSFPAGTKYVAIYYYSDYQYRLYVDDFSFTAPITGPALAVADADDSNTAVNSGYNYDFGLAPAGTTHYFILSNPGTESITLNIAATNGFGVSNNSLTLEAKKSSLLTVTMADATTSGTVTITPTASGVDPFTINVSGTIKDPNKLWCDFTSGVPTGWTNGGLTVSTTGAGTGTTGGGYVNDVGYGYSLTTPLLTFDGSEKMFFYAARSQSSSSYCGLKVEYSANGTSWTALTVPAVADIAYYYNNSWTPVELSGIPAGDYFIKFTLTYLRITDIYGGT